MNDGCHFRCIACMIFQHQTLCQSVVFHDYEQRCNTTSTILPSTATIPATTASFCHSPAFVILLFHFLKFLNPRVLCVAFHSLPLFNPSPPSVPSCVIRIVCAYVVCVLPFLSVHSCVTILSFSTV